MFNIEKVNYKLRNDGSGKTTKELEPLYCVAISAKRYCLFNLDKRGRPIIRKCTAHGLGDVMLPTGYKSRFEHVAAPVAVGASTKKPLVNRKTKKPQRVHGALVARSAAPLFLDMWMAAIKELQSTGNLDNIDNVIDTWPNTLDGTHHYQSSLGTLDAWMNYKSLPNRRPFQFMTCLSAPVQSFVPTWPHDFMQAEIEDACASSLYMAFSKPFKLDLDELYRRDNNEPIKPYLDARVVRLATVRDRIKDYFHHMEAKSEGVVGLLERRCVVGITKVWIGKESNPLADVEDLPDDETIDHYRTSGEIITDSALNHDLIAFAGISEVAQAARIDEALLVDTVMGQKAVRKHVSIRGLGPDAVNRIAAAINVNADGSIEIKQVPETRIETAMERVRILHKGKKLRELVKYIHSVTAKRVCLRAAAGETEATKRYEVEGPTHKQITHDIRFIYRRRNI